MRTNHQFLLVVDDDEDDRYLLNLLFHKIHWEDHVKLLESGESMMRYLEALANTSSYPSLILLDYHMPKMSGAEVLARLKSHAVYRHIPVMVYSTEMTDALCRQLKLLGAASCTKKEVGADQNLQFAEMLKNSTEHPQALHACC